MDERNARFTSEVKIELPLFLEFLNLNFDVDKRNTFIHLFQALLILHCLLNLPDPLYIGLFLLLGFLCPLLEWRNRRKFKDGGIAYKQLLFQHEGKTPHQLSYFEEEHLASHNLSTGRQRTTPYSHFVQLWESKNLLVLILDVNMYQLIDKRTLSGGTADDLIAFLMEKCPNLKKKVFTGRLGRFMRRLVWTVIAAALVISALCFFHLPEKVVGQLTNSTSNEVIAEGQLTNSTSYEEMAQALALLDIHISEDVMDLVTTGTVHYAPGTPSYYRVYYLLCWEGGGEYLLDGVPTDPHIPGTDPDKLTWVPSTSGVYWFDRDFVNKKTIYTDFLRGIDAMSEELTFDNITEDYSQADFDKDKGLVSISFEYIGNSYSLQADYQGSLFNTDMIVQLRKILESDSDERELWFCTDLSDGILVYYGTPNQVMLLEQKTGLTFTSWLALP